VTVVVVVHVGAAAGVGQKPATGRHGWQRDLVIHWGDAGAYNLLFILFQKLFLFSCAVGLTH
jgi:hypothetical protein